MRFTRMLLLTLAACLAFAPAALADTYTVTGLTDGGSCTGTTCTTLRAALAAANASPDVDDTIELPSGQIQLTAGSALQVTDAVMINGDGANLTTITANANLELRVFEITDTSATINGVSLQGGKAFGNDDNPHGGTVYALRSTVAMTGVHVYAGSALSGGGIANHNGTMAINESLIEGNFAVQGGGDGGGIINFGGNGGAAASMTIRNSTIAFNTARMAGGLVSYGNAQNAVYTSGVTIAQNRVSDRWQEGGGGIHIGDGSWFADSTLIGDNLHDLTATNCTGADAVSNGWNVENLNECGFTQDVDKHSVGDIGLDTVINTNGGPTATLKLLAGSPALSIRSLAQNCGGIDQRGVQRPQGSACDAGAFESELAPGGGPAQTVITSPAPDTYVNGTVIALTGTATPNTNLTFFLGDQIVSEGGADEEGDWTKELALPSTDGPVILGVQAGSTPRVDVRVFVDRTMPVAQIDSGPTTSDGAQVTFTYSASEPAEFTCQLVNSEPDPTACQPTGKTYNDLAPGQYTFEVRAIDRAGNHSEAPARRTLTVSATAPPAPVVTSPPDGTHTNEVVIDLTGTAVPGAQIRVLRSDDVVLGTGEADANGLWAFGAGELSGGENVLRVIARVDGVDSLPTTLRVTFDQTEPTVGITSSPPARTNVNDVTFTYTSSEPGGTFLCGLTGTGISGPAEAPCPVAGKTYLDLSDGEYEFTVHAVDRAGNRSEVPARFAFVVDTALIAAPEVSEPATDAAAAVFTFSTAQIGRTLSCRLEGPGRDAAFQPCSSPLRYDGLAPGDYRFTVRSSDSLGNFADAPVRVFTIAAPLPARPTPAPPAPTPTPAPTPVPAPTANEDVTVRPSGKVLVKAPGSNRFVELKSLDDLPLGSEIDTKNGKVVLRFESEKGKVQTGTFYGGIFKVTQVGKILDLKLTEALAACPKKGKAAAAQSKKKPKKRKLWGDGKGAFRTSGKYSAATVRGTKWLVEDSCAGTLTRVTSGVVAVRYRGKDRLVRAGKRFLAKPR